jgi:hypothetical protein
VIGAGVCVNGSALVFCGRDMWFLGGRNVCAIFLCTYSFALTAERRNNEWQKILTIAENNQYPLHLITRLKAQTQQKQQEPKTKEKGKK